MNEPTDGSVPSLAAMLGSLRKHTAERVAALPRAVPRRRTYTEYLCPECGTRLAAKDPTVYNGPAVDTRDGSLVERGPICLLWSCVNRCRSAEPSPSDASTP